MESAARLASPPSPPRKAPLPRAGTFRTSRPPSTGASGLRRGSTVLTRPQSYSSPDGPWRDGEHAQHSPPRLRRGSSFVASRARPAAPDDPPAPPLLRRGVPRNHTDAPPARAARRLARAGTFAAFGASAPADAGPDDAKRKEQGSTVGGGEGASEIGRHGSTERTCGMCSGCGAGLKGMPPWAPERLAGMSAAERSAVFRELQHKEERGRLEAELRKKRLSEMRAVASRLEKRRGARDELETESASEGRRSGSRVASDEFDELESVDLGTEVASQRSASRASKRRSRSENGSASTGVGEREFGADISGAVLEGGKGRRRGRLEEDCAQCGDLEGKVKDLEEQLGVLREVVSMCGESAEAGEKDKENGKKPKTWKDKVISAYFGGSAVAGERSRLRAEVDALRKATDFLFQKLQQNGK